MRTSSSVNTWVCLSLPEEMCITRPVAITFSRLNSEADMSSHINSGDQLRPLKSVVRSVRAVALDDTFYRYFSASKRTLKRLRWQGRTHLRAPGPTRIAAPPHRRAASAKVGVLRGSIRAFARRTACVSPRVSLVSRDQWQKNISSKIATDWKRSLQFQPHRFSGTFLFAPEPHVLRSAVRK